MRLSGRNTMTQLGVRQALLCAAAIAMAMSAAPANAAVACNELVNLKIASGDLGLPSGGATISSAEMSTVPADPATPEVKRDYCKVLGAVLPVDVNAPPVNFQVNLPMQWNGK